MYITMNGEARDFAGLAAGSTLADLIDALELKGDRIAVELNGAIVSRKDWPATPIFENDKLEVVHFVGGGAAHPGRRSISQRLGWLATLFTPLLLIWPSTPGTGFAQANSAQPAPPTSAEPAPLPNSASPASGMQGALPPVAISSDSSPSGKPTFLVNEIKPGADLKIVAYGDSRFTDPKNTSDANPRARKWLVDQIAKVGPDAIFFSGDMPFRGSDPADWLVFQEETEPWRAAHLRLYPTLGNHDVAPEPHAGIANYFANLPQLEEHRWYSVEMGNVYLIALDSQWAPKPGTAQRAWLEAQLANVPATTDFVFFLSHFPLVTDIQTQIAVNLPTPEQVELRNYIEAQSRKSHAKFVVLNGHIHNYERYERNGVSYIVTGGGGAKPYPVMMRSEQDLYRQPGFPNFHYLVFQIHGKHAVVTMNRLADPQAETLKEEVRETFTLDGK